MTEPILLIDQGNTRLKWILAGHRELLLDTAGRGNFDVFKRTCMADGADRPGSILLSSVAGDAAAQAVTDFCRTQWGLKPLRLKSTRQAGGVRNGYTEPESLGTDRWLAIIGAVSHYGKPVVIWDLGTAATLDAVDETGQHIGGMIYPGPATMLSSLVRDTKLGVPERLSGATTAPGRSTAGCIGNGVFAAQLGALNQFLKNQPESAGGKPKLIMTGGAATDILPFLDFEVIHDPWLVFRGMLVQGNL